jgi:hypothetical protein
MHVWPICVTNNGISWIVQNCNGTQEIIPFIMVTIAGIETKIVLTRFCANLIRRSLSHISTIIAPCALKTDQITLS